MFDVPIADKVEPGWIPTQVAAKSCGVTRQAFVRWEVPPVAKVGRTTYYTMADILANRIAHELSKRKPELDPDEPEEGGLDYERYRLTKAQADAQELKNEVSRQEVVPVEFASFSLSKVAAAASGILDSLPLNLIRKHPELTTVQQENIKRELSKAMNALSSLDEDMPEHLDDYLRETAS